ncbi:hypothetical protein OIU78_027477 [Salix suchowensis]|nr:hypothetical protein OIU78_027477 [Salix suchowensis]
MASVAHSSTQAVSTGDVNSDASAFQLIQTHQEKAARLPPVEEIRTVLNQSTHGMLSTISQLAQLNGVGVGGDVMVGLFVVVISRVMTLYLKFSRGRMGGWRVHSGIRSIFVIDFVCYMYLTSTCIGIDVGDAI